MKRDDFWRLRYRARRYLEHANENDIWGRVRDILSNLTVLSPEGKVAFLQSHAGGAYWMEMFAHALEECKLRRLTLPPGLMDGAALPKPTYPHVPKAWALLASSRFDPRINLVRYGEVKYLTACRAGRWRLRPASSYDDPSLGPARQDAELKQTRYGLQRETTISIINHKTAQTKLSTHPIGNMTVVSQSVTDYYVICLAKVLSLRLFDDFAADSCVIIRDVREFARRMFVAVRQILPRWRGHCRDVGYLDPYNPGPGTPDVFFTKHFRYCYQQEVRFIWLPPEPINKITEPIFVELGPLDDVCEMLTLPEG